MEYFTLDAFYHYTVNRNYNFVSSLIKPWIHSRSDRYRRKYWYFVLHLFFLYVIYIFLLYCCVLYLFWLHATAWNTSRIYQGRQREPGNLMLSHFISTKMLPFSTFRRILEALSVDWRNSTPSFASLQELENENIKYFIS